MRCVAARCGRGPQNLVQQRRRISNKKQPVFRTKAEADSETDPRTFDEGAAQVRRLMNRDKTKFSGPDFEALLEEQFSTDTTEDLIKEMPNDAKVETGPVSPFGSAGSTKVIDPFNETPLSSSSKLESSAVDADMYPAEEKEPWWSFVQNITITQIVLVCSFVLIVSAMLGTFAFVLKSGAIHFND